MQHHQCKQPQTKLCSTQVNCLCPCPLCRARVLYDVQLIESHAVDLLHKIEVLQGQVERLTRRASKKP